MHRTQRPRPPRRRRRIRRLGAALLLVALAAIVAGGVRQGPAPSLGLLTRAASLPRALGAADGALPDGATAADVALPGVARLDPGLARALRRATADAAAGGVGLVVDSGWRSPAYQAQLLHDAVRTYGSRAQAARWVASPSTSAHVSGDAVDVGPPGAAAWLAAHGAALELCAVYANEPWHFELRRGAGARGCPAVYADPTHDPRMQGR